MIRAILGWIQHRTNFRGMFDALLLEHIPGGAKWRYVWGSCLSFVFAIQVLTGVLLMTAYSPGESSAWGSVYFIQYEMDFGWLIRGLHHFGSQMMVVLLFLHMLQVVIAGAHLPPREFNWWLGLLLMGCVLGLSLTGYLLPWDQKGYWATQVATKIMSSMPFIGTWLQNIVVGGPDYGNATLTRFFGMHVAILPGLLVVLLIAHLALFRRHGITYPGYPNKDKVEGEGWFWPDQVFRDMIACLVVLGIMLFLVFNGHGVALNSHGSPTAAGEHITAEEAGVYEYWAKAGQHGLGANLDAPADPAVQYDPRPEWYYLFLFQLLKYFEGEQEVIGTMVIPGGVTLILFLLPLLGFGKMRPIGNILSTIVVVALIASIVSLTCLALAQDTPEEVPHALLNRLGWPIVPMVAGIYLIYLGISALARGGARWVVVPIGMTLVALLMVGTGGLIFAALNNDVPEPVAELIKKKIAEEEKATPESAEKFKESLQKAKNFQEAVHKAYQHAERAIELAHQPPPKGGGNIPALGGKYLLRNDPKTQFKRLFLNNCASCHSYADERVVDFAKIPDFKPAFFINREKEFKDAKFTASDLAGYGTKEWIHSFLKKPGDKRFLGRIVDPDGNAWYTKMKTYVSRKYKDAKREGDDAAVAELEADFGKIAAWLASHPTETEFKKPELKEGFELFRGEKYACISCHQYAGLNKDAVSAPDLTGYAGQKWLHKMIRSPGHPDLYSVNNIMEIVDKNGKKTFKSLMPSFWPTGNDIAELNRNEYELLIKKTLPDVPKIDFEVLSDVDREMIVRYLTGDYRVVFGGQEITGVEVKKKEE